MMTEGAKNVYVYMYVCISGNLAHFDKPRDVILLKVWCHE